MAETGLVVARFRRHALVEDHAGDVYDCQIQGRRLRPVVGDNVEWRRETDGTCVVQAVRSRGSTLQRLDSAVARRSWLPTFPNSSSCWRRTPSPTGSFWTDTCARRTRGTHGSHCLHKMDLVENAPGTLEVYSRIGYRIVLTSAVEKTGLDELEQVFGAERGALIGQSGVGKSSLFNALLGEAVQRVGRLSGRLLQGRHTTTTSVLHRHPDGGEIIDSPGVRNYAPYIARPADVQLGFREFVACRDQCRFDDCTHRAEPDCAVKAALREGTIDGSRYENYHRLYEQTVAARAY